jgi:hypothetical protein
LISLGSKFLSLLSKLLRQISRRSLGLQGTTLLPYLSLPLVRTTFSECCRCRTSFVFEKKRKKGTHLFLDIEGGSDAKEGEDTGAELSPPYSAERAQPKCSVFKING